MAVVDLPLPEAVDLEFLREITTNDAEFESEILELFLNSTEETFKNLKKALEENDQELWLSCSHTFKGACSSIGAFYLAEIAEYAQSHPKDSKEKKVKIFNSVQAEFKRVKDFIKKIQKESAVKSKRA